MSPLLVLTHSTATASSMMYTTSDDDGETAKVQHRPPVEHRVRTVHWHLRGGLRGGPLRGRRHGEGTT